MNGRIASAARAQAIRWRGRASRALLACLLLAPWIGATAATDDATNATLDLGGDWQMRQAPDSAERTLAPATLAWQRASVPGTVHTDLLAAGRVPDPYTGMVEGQLQWIGLADWEYQRHFDVDAATLRAARSDLVFDGLDTFADVYLNGARILGADNAFRTWRVPVQGKLRAHDNTLRIVFHSPIRRVLPDIETMPNKIAGNYPSPWGDEPKDAMTGNFVRKPGYHYGWDWGPRYVTAGIWKPVRLEHWDAARIADLHVRQRSLDAARAELDVQTNIDVASAGRFILQLWQTAPDGTRTSAGHQVVSLQSGSHVVSMPLRIDAPQRWYPAGYGAQALYRIDAQLEDADNHPLATANKRIGLRTLELRREADAHGTSFTFVVNGIPVFAKGANFIPTDMFAPRTTPAQLRALLQAARDANMTMLRVWGGGDYGSDAFYDEADKLGLLVWQDFMFGGGMQPFYDDAFRDNALHEAREQIARLRDHPSLVLWAGNNEEEAAWKDWGQGKALTQADPVFAKRVWSAYQRMFGQDLRGLVRDLDDAPYWPSSPSNDLLGKPNTTDAGDMHYWEVWGNPAYPPVKYLEITPRFMSEYGLQAWPDLRTVRAFAGDASLSVDAPVIKAHQKFMAGEGNTRLLKYVEGEFGAPRDFATFVYLSQLMQAEGIELAALHHRASRPVTMGSLFWQLNDVWPGASWSAIDWFARPKALWFHARRFYAPVAVAALRKDGTTRVSLLSDRTQPRHGTLRTRLFALDGRVLRERSQAVELPPLSATVALTLPDSQVLGAADPRASVAVFDLQVDDEPPSRSVVYFDAAKNLRWSDPRIDARLTPDGDHLRLDLAAHAVARGVWIDFGDRDATLQDNALTLVPGESVSLRVDSSAAPDELRKALRIRSLADALAPSDSDHAPH